MPRLNVFTYTTSPVKTTHHICPVCGNYLDVKRYESFANDYQEADCQCGGAMSDYQAAHERDGSLYIIIPPDRVPGPGIPTVDMVDPPHSEKRYLNIVEKLTWNFQTNFSDKMPEHHRKVSISCNRWHVPPTQKQLKFLRKVEQLEIYVILHSDLVEHPDLNSSVRRLLTNDLRTIQDEDVYAFMVLSRETENKLQEAMREGIPLTPPQVEAMLAQSERNFPGRNEPPISGIDAAFEDEPEMLHDDYDLTKRVEHEKEIKNSREYLALFEDPDLQKAIDDLKLRPHDMSYHIAVTNYANKHGLLPRPAIAQILSEYAAKQDLLMPGPSENNPLTNHDRELTAAIDKLGLRVGNETNRAVVKGYAEQLGLKPEAAISIIKTEAEEGDGKGLFDMDKVEKALYRFNSVNLGESIDDAIKRLATASGQTVVNYCRSLINLYEDTIDTEEKLKRIHDARRP